jgi:hypothetical protein
MTKGGDVAGECDAGSPAQAELRPPCAGAFGISPRLILSDYGGGAAKSQSAFLELSPRPFEKPGIRKVFFKSDGSHRVRPLRFVKNSAQKGREGRGKGRLTAPSDVTIRPNQPDHSRRGSIARTELGSSVG